MDPTTAAYLAAAIIPTVGTALTGGGGGYTKGQKRLYNAQADIAELMSALMQSRSQLTDPMLAQGLTMSLQNAQQAQRAPIQKVENTTPYDPYASFRNAQGMPSEMTAPPPAPTSLESFQNAQGMPSSSGGGGPNDQLIQLLQLLLRQYAPNGSNPVPTS